MNLQQDMDSRDKRLRMRLADLDHMIEAASQWGAALTAMEEERRAILRSLKQMRSVRC